MRVREPYDGSTSHPQNTLGGRAELASQRTHCGAEPVEAWLLRYLEGLDPVPPEVFSRVGELLTDS
jgi:hypothetical protein